MKCDTKRCRNEMAVVVSGKNMCWDCWTKKCRADEKLAGEQNGK